MITVRLTAVTWQACVSVPFLPGTKDVVHRRTSRTCSAYSSSFKLCTLWSTCKFMTLESEWGICFSGVPHLDYWALGLENILNCLCFIFVSYCITSLLPNNRNPFIKTFCCLPFNAYLYTSTCSSVYSLGPTSLRRSDLNNRPQLQ